MPNPAAASRRFVHQIDLVMRDYRRPPARTSSRPGFRDVADEQQARQRDHRDAQHLPAPIVQARRTRAADRLPRSRAHHARRTLRRSARPREPPIAPLRQVKTVRVDGRRPSFAPTTSACCAGPRRGSTRARRPQVDHHFDGGCVSNTSIGGRHSPVTAAPGHLVYRAQPGAGARHRQVGRFRVKSSVILLDERQRAHWLIGRFVGLFQPNEYECIALRKLVYIHYYRYHS